MTDTNHSNSGQTSPRLDSKVPAGDVADLWENHKFSMKLVNPNNKRRTSRINSSSRRSAGSNSRRRS